MVKGQSLGSCVEKIPNTNSTINFLHWFMKLTYKPHKQFFLGFKDHLLRTKSLIYDWPQTRRRDWSTFFWIWLPSEVEFHHLCVSCRHNCVKTYYAGLRGYIIFEEQFALDLPGFAENERERYISKYVIFRYFTSNT